MSSTVYIAATSRGVALATQDRTGKWNVQTMLDDLVVRCIAVDPLHRDRVYAGTQEVGVLRSDDGGKSWQASGLSRSTVTSIAASPVQSGLVYAGTKPARIFVSLDGGDTWNELTAFRRIPWRWLWFSPAERPFSAYVQAIALSPTDPARLFAGIELGATVSSDDGGATWSRHRRGALRDCHSLTFHHHDANWLYEAGGTGGGAAVSRDGGQTWSRPKDGLDRHYGWAVAADPAQPDIWYVAVSPGPSRAHSEDNAQAFVFRRDGNRWKRLSGGLPQPLNHMPYALITDPNAPNLLYAGLSNGDIWLSHDRGEDWEQLPVNLGVIRRSLVITKALAPHQTA